MEYLTIKYIQNNVEKSFIAFRLTGENFNPLLQRNDFPYTSLGKLLPFKEPTHATNLIDLFADNGASYPVVGSATTSIFMQNLANRDRALYLRLKRGASVGSTETVQIGFYIISGYDGTYFTYRSQQEHYPLNLANITLKSRAYVGIDNDNNLFLIVYGQQAYANTNQGTTPIWISYADDFVTYAIKPSPYTTTNLQYLKLDYVFGTNYDVLARYKYSDSDEWGRGVIDNTSDDISYPIVPNVNVQAFTNTYALTANLLADFKSELFSNDVLDIIKRWWDKTTDCIVSLNVAPLSLPEIFTTVNSQHIKVGTHSMDALGFAVPNGLYEVDCGFVDIQERFGNFADWENTVIQCYLPFVGFIPLKTVDVMDARLSLKYTVNLVTGDFNAYVNVYRNRFGIELNSIIYETCGNMFAQLPVTSADYSNAIKSVFNTITSGAITTASAMSGNLSGVIAGTSGIASSVMSASPSVQRSGNFNRNASLGAIRMPFVLIERPDIAIPKSLVDDKGFVANISSKIGDLSGYTEVRHVNLDGIDLTASEKARLDSILKSGFYV